MDKHHPMGPDYRTSIENSLRRWRARGISKEQAQEAIAGFDAAFTEMFGVAPTPDMQRELQEVIDRVYAAKR